MKWLPAIALSLWAFGAYMRGFQGQVQHPPGAVAPENPIQTQTLVKPFAFPGGRYTIKPLADFSIRARVLSREDYYMGHEADLSPIDLAFGWGPMSDTAVIKQFTISQGGRFYFWRYEGTPPIPHQDIISHSANMHLIPANKRIRKKLKTVRRGQVVSLKGHLVAVNATDGFSWTSSLTRDDTGAGACEVIWVTAVSIKP
jgi:hypothetical protein